MRGKVLSFLQARWLLLLVLIVFICFKIPHLQYPFYKDEGWVYAPAVKTMAVNGPSLLPGSIPDIYSRGHPLLFHFLCSLWIRIFGASNAAIHSFPLLLSIIFLVLLYECCLRLFNKRVATVALLLVATRVIFFVQSSFVYPEVMVALFAFLSLYFYARDKLLLTSLMLFMLFFSKEGGLVFGAVLGVDALINLWRKKESIQRRLLRVASVLVPTILLGLFFALQKAKLGWYVLPEHRIMILTDWKAYYFMLRRGIYWAYRGDIAMYILAVFTILLSLVPAVRLKNVRYLFLCLPAIIVYILAEKFATNSTGSVLWVVLYLLCFALPVYYLLQLNTTLSAQARRFTILLGICVVVFLFYTSLIVVAYRYLLVNIVLMLVFLAVCMDTFAAASKLHYYTTIGGILVIGVYGFYSNEGVEDTDLAAFNVMSVQLKEAAFLEKENAFDKEIAYSCSTEWLSLTDTMEGFTHRPFTNMKHFPVGPHADYALFGNACTDVGDYERIIKNPDFHLVYTVKDGKIWAAIYKRN